MRKVLLVHDEIYLNRALENVQSLMGFERRASADDDVFDLLAVILIPPATLARALPEKGHLCNLSRLEHHHQLFSPDWISVNGIWLLLTVCQPDLLEPTARQEALSRILDTFKTKGCIQSLNAVYPVFSSSEKERSPGEQISYLESEHPGLPPTNALFIDSKKISGAPGTDSECLAG
ncbi:MAG: hypothetical protein HIU93_00850 [Acidobacteria bacterium]|nr:hypothetical protein [Acidobacteriota bacterium]MBW4044154.1 hypothetical protein [Acidobacteriota bacterium]